MRLALLSVCILGIDISLVCAAPPIEGDGKLLQLLQDAQATNKTLFRRGKMDIEVHQNRDRAVATLIWSGEKTYWDYTHWDRTRDAKGKPITIVSRVRMVKTPKELMWYSPEAQLLQRIKDKSRGYPSLLNARPDDIWFSLEGVVDWAEILDPAQAHKGVTKYVIRKKDDAHVVVERHHSSGVILSMEASLKQGGNIIAYESIPPPGNKSLPLGKRAWWNKGTYDWAKDENQNWYLKRYAWQNSNEGDPEILNFDFTLDIKNFDPNPRIPNNRFQVASLKVVPGTTVEEVGGKGRTYRIGKKGKEKKNVSQEVLDRLAEKIRSLGFASPDRTSK